VFLCFLKIKEMKVKHILVVFLVAYVLETAGVHFKIMQLAGAPQLFTAATSLKVTAAILAIWKLISIKDFSNLLNR
jgi:hypothetical protein